MFGKSTKQTAPTVAWPENDEAVVALTAEREQLHQQLEKLSTEINAGRGKLDDMVSSSAAGLPHDRDKQSALVRQINDAHEQRQVARRRLREIADASPLAMQAAARRIAATHESAFNAMAATFLKAKLERLAPEIAAATSLLALRDELVGRRVGLRGCCLPGSAVRADQEIRQLREDVQQALAAGVLKTSDIPPDVAAAWGIK